MFTPDEMSSEIVRQGRSGRPGTGWGAGRRAARAQGGVGEGAGNGAGSPESRKISAEELAELLGRAGGRPLVVDVREPAELEGSALPGAVNVPLAELHLRLEELAGHLRDLAGIVEPCENGLHMVTVCASGNRSAVAAELLSRNGWQVGDLDGGMSAWQAFRCGRRG